MAADLPGTPRDESLRRAYLDAAWPHIPRLLGAIDRNPYRPTYGCLDRQYWHYRTAAFPSEMYQEGALPLALAFTAELPGNRWRGNPRVCELAVAALRFSAKSSHRDGSCDDYYPYERALGAAVFSFQAATRAYQLLGLDDAEVLAWLKRRAHWLADHDESGRLTNHHAVAALGLLRLAQITGEEEYRRLARRRIDLVLGWQSTEGWFEEYGGADPGYQTVTIDALAKCRRALGDGSLDEPLGRAVAFARGFLHPDDSFGGEYGSRGTYHFYPHGMELLAAGDPNAAALANGFLRSLRSGTAADFSDDRLFAHRLGNLIEAYLDWSPTAPSAAAPETPRTQWFPGAGLLVHRATGAHTIVSAARGGVVKRFAADRPPVTDAGLILETTDGRIAVSQSHGLSRAVEFTIGAGPCRPEIHGATRPGSDSACPDASLDGDAAWSLAVAGPLHWVRFELATPWKQAVLHVGMCTVGRWCRTLVRRLLQRRLITGRRESPIRLSRRFEMTAGRLRITDTIELVGPRLHVRRMAFGVDHQSAYVAASGVYQSGVLAPWTDLAAQVDELNRRRRVTIVRDL